MNQTSDARIAQIRERVRSERALIAELNVRISDDLKTLLRTASHHLDDAEGFLAPEVLRHPPRSEIEMTKWLQFVESILDRAVKHREWVEGLVRQHGPDARVVGR
jgi:hypothetical protein